MTTTLMLTPTQLHRTVASMERHGGGFCRALAQAWFVADRGNRRIQVLALDGTPVAIHTDGVRMPCDMKFRGNLMLVPDLESVVCLYDESFKSVVALGDGHPTNLRGQPTESFQFGRFVHPHDAIWLADGSILVAEWVPQGRVTRLTPVKG